MPETGITQPSNTDSFQSGLRRQAVNAFGGDGSIALTPIAVNVTTTVHDDRSMKSDIENGLEKPKVVMGRAF